MKCRWLHKGCAVPLRLAVLILILASVLARAQVVVVNMTPASSSGETNNDAEPNLAVNPANASRIAATAFTPCPNSMIPDAPIYISTDGGHTWQLNCIVPGGNNTYGTGDITIRFAGTSGVLYAGDLRGDSYLRMNILRTNDFTGLTPMTVLVDRTSEDQPYMQATTVLGGVGAGNDRAYVGNNHFGSSQTATVDLSLDAATALPPAGFSPHVIETRSTCGQDGPPVRPAIHSNGIVYAAFFHWTACSGSPYTADVVVARDDNWGSGGTPFRALFDLPSPPGDGGVGKRVATGRSIPWAADFGSQITLSSQISIAVDPNNYQTVWVAWADGTSASNYTIHVRRSIDGGANWSADLKMVVPATNPALAISTIGTVGFLYQRLVNPGTCSGGGACWETHLERTTDGTTWMDVFLANVSAAPHTGVHRDLGDYVHLMAVGTDFYGVFSGDNTPDMGNFPNGVTFQRNFNPATKKLRNLTNTADVPTSIDPFFFKVTITLSDLCDEVVQFHNQGKMGTGAFHSLQQSCRQASRQPRNVCTHLRNFIQHILNSAHAAPNSANHIDSTAAQILLTKARALCAANSCKCP